MNIMFTPTVIDPRLLGNISVANLNIYFPLISLSDLSSALLIKELLVKVIRAWLILSRWEVLR
jgi:hypothetical protein